MASPSSTAAFASASVLPPAGLGPVLLPPSASSASASAESDVLEVDVLCAMLEARKASDRLRLADDPLIKALLQQYAVEDAQRAAAAIQHQQQQQLLKQHAAAASKGKGSAGSAGSASAAKPKSAAVVVPGAGAGPGSPPRSPTLQGLSGGGGVGSSAELPFSVRLPDAVLNTPERVLCSDVVTKLNRKQKAQSRSVLCGLSCPLLYQRSNWFVLGWVALHAEC
jgi:hypothetical protein